MIEQFDGENRWLSNFAPCSVTLDGVEYPSTENAYQASKTTNLKQRIPFQQYTAGQSKRAGATLTKRSDWDTYKLDVMYDVNLQKYQQEPYKSKLLGTGTQHIKEGNTWGDVFWGVCNNEGKNHLGRIIMRIRKELTA